MPSHMANSYWATQPTRIGITELAKTHLGISKRTWHARGYAHDVALMTRLQRAADKRGKSDHVTFDRAIATEWAGGVRASGRRAKHSPARMLQRFTAKR